MKKQSESLLTHEELMDILDAIQQLNSVQKEEIVKEIRKIMSKRTEDKNINPE